MKRTELIALLFLLSIFVGLCFFGQKKNSVTVDEFAHLPAGYYYWQTRDFRLYAKNPPLIKMSAALPLNLLKPCFEPDLKKFPQTGWLPWFFANDFMVRNRAEFINIFQAGRLMTILLGSLLGLALFFAAKSRYGRTGAFLSLTAWVFCPEALAHSMMATVDIGASLCIFLAVLTLLNYLNKPDWKRTLLAGFCLGLAQLAKFSSLALLVFYPLAPFFLLWPFRKDRLKIRSFALRSGQVLTMLLLCLIVVAAGYGFQGLFKKTADFRFQSRLMAEVQKIFRPWPAPFPETYLKGLDGQIRDMESGEFANYLMGRWYSGVSRKYFPIALILKVPIPIQLLALFALALGFRPGKKRLKFSPEEMLLLAVIAWLLLLFSLKNSLQIGVRYLLPLFPLGLLMTARLAKNAGMLRRILTASLMLWLALETIYFYPHYLSYFNEFAGGPKNGHKFLLDSNLDWGQDLPALADFMKQNKIDRIELDYFGHADPGIYGVRYQVLGQEPRLEYAAVSAQLLFGGKRFFYPMLFVQPPLGGVIVNPEKVIPFQNKKPVGRAGYSIWIFEND